MLLTDRPIRYSLQAEGRWLRLHVVAGTAPGVFAEAARATAQLMGADLEEQATGDVQFVLLRAASRNALFESWLEELIHRSEQTGFLFTFTEIAIEILTDDELSAVIRGQFPGPRQHAVRLASRPGPSIVADPRTGWSGAFVLERLR